MKKLACTILLLSLVTLAACSNAVLGGPSEITFSNSYENFDHQNTKRVFSTNEDIAMNMDFGGKVNTTSVGILVLQGKDEEIYDSFDMDTDPSWPAMIAELYWSGELDPGLYTVKAILHDQDIVSVGKFKVE
ncbi:hypothetical protein IMZ31_22290 (plasmid) [Pontibacillus sp. ALD_SL1]|uniref:hypothetical protein n=1 Tax=Pontibacillus sp. ALD_SL1 TaxID=2777185 RepID=UPI001A965294|nr:hypothetical protein [Pontibacillus sp. ALD_SL1]QST02185.1 hypothetical protein IMZ31_22290 [Pontibacillus sp. ALD_SL1]